MKKIITILILSFIGFSIHAQVAQQWVQRFNGPDSLFDASTAIDINDNVYVTGRTLTPSGERIAVIKYSSDGFFIWSVFTNGHQPVGITVDNFANSYITGISDSGTFITAKFNSAGQQMWAVATANTSIPTSIALDNNNNVCVTGASNANQITTVKYNSNGVQQWLRNFQNNPITGSARGNAITTDLNGNIYVTGLSHSGTSFDYTTLKYNAGGTLQWFKYYNGPGNATDVATAIAFANNTIYITGFSEGSGTGLDYATIKYTANGTQQWVARYNGTGNGTDISNAIAVFNGKVYVTGSSSGTSSNLDYATIQYNNNGLAIWAQRYNGPGNSDDVANALAVDKNGNAYVTGGSQGNGTNSDYATIQYNKNGQLIWLQRYNGSANGLDEASAIALDGKSNAYVTGLSFGGVTNFDFATIKYNTNIPNQTQQIVDNIKALAVGLVNISQNDTVQQIVYQSALLDVDKFFNVRIDSLIAIAQRQGIDVKASMNASISSAYGLDPNKDHVKRILQNTKFKGNKLPIYIAIPHFSNFTPAQLALDPSIAYSNFESDYPIPCINCPAGELTSASSQVTPAWVIVIKLPPWYASNGPDPVTIYNCTAKQPVNISDRCQVCPPPTFPIDGVPQGTGTNLMNHEIEINLGVNGLTNTSDNCLVLSPTGFNSDLSGSSNCATLSMISGFTYYRRSTTFSPFTTKIFKLPFGIVDRCHNPLGICGGTCPNLNQSCWAKEGQVLSLCANKTLFNSWEEEITVRYALGYGGVFLINRPGVINQKPLYFASPYSRGIWFTQGPDMRVYYGVDDPISNCTSGRRKVEEDYETRGCEFCTTAPLTIPYINSSNVTDYLASTDASFIQNYWLDNVVTVGFRSGNGNQVVTSGNIRFFNGVASPPSPCTLSGTLVGQLFLGSDNGYEIDKDLLSAVIPGTVLTIHVRAKFSNGESIDECQTLTINSAFNITNVTAEIRRNIKDYSSSVINYQIDIFK